MFNEYHQYMSLTTGVFPDSLKKAHVTPIPKEGDKCNLSNYIYSPISVLPVYSKVLEKITCRQLYDYLENNSICININMAFVFRSVLLMTFYISYNTCISI